MAGIYFTAKLKRDVVGRSLHRGRDASSIMRDLMGKEMSIIEQSFKTLYLRGKHTTDSSLAERSGNLIRNTYSKINMTAGGGVTGHLVVGEGLPYTHLHVGTGETKTVHTRGSFVVPFAWVRKQRGGLISPFRYGSLGSVKGLFRTRSKGLNPDILYYKRSKDTPIKGAFILKRELTFRQRVDLREFMEFKGDYLRRRLEEAFEGYDFGYMSMRMGS